MKRALILAALLAGCVLVLQASAANPGRHARSEHPRARMQRSEGHQAWGGARLEALNLSESQRDKIARIRESHQRERIQAQADLKTARIDFRKLMREDRPDKRAINAQIDRMASIRADMMKSRIEQQLEVRETLTRDQRAKLREGGKGRGWEDPSHDVGNEAPPRDQDPRRP